MNAVREVWQAALASDQPPAPLLLALQEMLARLLGPQAPSPLRQLMLVGAASQVGTSFVAGHWAPLLAAVFGNVLLVEVKAGAVTAPAEWPDAVALAGRGTVARVGLSEDAAVAMMAGGGAPAEWTQAFGMVLWDLPPLTVSPVALLLARRVDGIVLLVQAHRTRSHVAQHAALRLQESGGRMLGVVLNRTLDFIPGWIYRLL